MELVLQALLHAWYSVHAKVITGDMNLRLYQNWLSTLAIQPGNCIDNPALPTKMLQQILQPAEIHTCQSYLTLEFY